MLPSSLLIGNYSAQALLLSSLLIGNYSAVTLTHRVVWYMVEADVDVLESRACYVQLAVLLTTHYSSHQWLSLIAVEGTHIMLPPLDPGLALILK